MRSFGEHWASSTGAEALKWAPFSSAIDLQCLTWCKRRNSRQSTTLTRICIFSRKRKSRRRLCCKSRSALLCFGFSYKIFVCLQCAGQHHAETSFGGKRGNCGRWVAEQTRRVAFSCQKTDRVEPKYWSIQRGWRADGVVSAPPSWPTRSASSAREIHAKRHRQSRDSRHVQDSRQRWPWHLWPRRHSESRITKDVRAPRLRAERWRVLAEDLASRRTFSVDRRECLLLMCDWGLGRDNATNKNIF